MCFNETGLQPGGHLNIKMSSYPYRDGLATVLTPTWESPFHTWERRSLYWDGALNDILGHYHHMCLSRWGSCVLHEIVFLLNGADENKRRDNPQQLQIRENGINSLRAKFFRERNK